MKRLSVGFLLVAAASAQTRPITHEDVWLMKRSGEPVVSPDGRRVVFALTEPDYDPAKTSVDLWVSPSDGSSAPRRLTFTKAPESGAVWSPDGTRLAFVTKREGDEAAQVYVMSMSGGEAERVTSIPAGASNPQWRPDGKAILFQSDLDPVAAERKLRKSPARIYDSMPVRFWNLWMDEKRPRIFTQELRDGAQPLDVLKDSKLAASPGFGGVFSGTGTQELQAVWAPDGKSIVFVAMVNRNQMMSEEPYSALFAVTASGGEPRQLSESGQSVVKPTFSPQCDWLYTLQERLTGATGRLYSLARLARVSWPSASGQTGVKTTFLTESWDRSVSDFSIAADARTIYISAEDDGFDQLYQVPAQGGTVQRLFAVKRGGYSVVHPVAGGLVALYQTSAQPPEIVRLALGSTSHTALTSFNAERLAQIDAPPPTEFWFTAKNGKRIHNLMFYPPKFDPGKRYPLVIFPHGGPNNMSSDVFSGRWNNYLLASPGYVILETNYTGSTGFGEKFAGDVERDVLRGPAQELLEAISEAVRRYPFIDERRQAAAGGSYGGYLVNWLNGHTDQFKCIVSHAGAMSNESQYGVNDGGIKRELRMGGPVWEHGGQWKDQSPLSYAGSFHTPTLITQGEIDFRVPLNESMTTFKVLQRLKVPSRLVIFPDEGHWILKGEDSRLHMQEVLSWLAHYL